jgi:hypothetical protein
VDERERVRRPGLYPELKDHPVYKAGVIASFISTSWGFTGLASVAWKRWLQSRG